MNRRLLAAAAGAVLSLFPGCMNLDHHTSRSHYGSAEEKAEAEKALARSMAGPVSQVQAAWENRVIVTQDAVNNGAPLVGLLGKLHFFGDEVGFPRTCKGTITVDAHEILPDGKTKMMERWQIDPITMQKLIRKDTLGSCYTIFLPWSTYRPDMARVQLQVKFVPETGGVPLFSTPTAVSLLQESQPVITGNVIPAGGARK